MDTGKPLLYDFIFKVQNPHLWKMSKENVLCDFKFYFYQHTVLLCEIGYCVPLNKQEAKSTLWSKSFHKWMDSENDRMLLFGAVTALTVSRDHPGGRRSTCHQPLPSRIRPPQSMGDQGSASPPPPRQPRSAAVSPTAAVNNTQPCSARKQA